MLATSRKSQGYRADITVNNAVIVELKSVEHILPLHEAQLLTYMRLSHCDILYHVPEVVTYLSNNAPYESSSRNNRHSRESGNPGPNVRCGSSGFPLSRE